MSDPDGRQPEDGRPATNGSRRRRERGPIPTIGDGDRRRQVLVVLEECPGWLSERALAVELGERAPGWGSGTDSETGPDLDAIECSLHHNHLPALAAEGLIERDGGRVVARAGDRPSDPSTGSAASSTDGRTTAAGRGTADRAATWFDAGTRRTVEAVVADGGGPTTLAELTAAVARREGASTLPASDRESLAVALHHVHLPKLDDAGVLTYAPDRNTCLPADSPPATGDGE